MIGSSPRLLHKCAENRGVPESKIPSELDPCSRQSDKKEVFNDAEFICAFCGMANAIAVDPTGGYRQQYVEDCQTCCRPNLLTIEIEPGTNETRVDADPESD